MLKIKQIVHKLTGLCMELNDKSELVAGTCSTANSKQNWNWKANKKI